MTLTALPPLFSLAPPYEQYEPVLDFTTLIPDDLPDGALLAIGVGAPAGRSAELSALVPAIRARCPGAPIVLRTRASTAPGESEGVTTMPDGLRLPRIPFDDFSPGPRLRRLLTDAAGFPDALEQWLPLRLPDLSPTAVRMVGRIVRLAPSYAEVGLLMRSLGWAGRTMRTWLRQEAVPGPGKWLSMAHAVNAALRLQMDDRQPLLQLAVDCGYSDPSSLGRQSARLFGVRPGAMRRMLGWEWMVDRWLRRSAEAAPAAPAPPARTRT